MSSKYVRDQVAAYLAANWVTTAIVDSENIESPSLPADLAPWLTVYYPAANEFAPCLGPRDVVRKREVGTFLVVVYVASGTGTATAQTYAESVRTLMRGQNLNGVDIDSAQPPDYAVPNELGASEGNYFGYSVACEYEYDFT